MSRNLSFALCIALLSSACAFGTELHDAVRKLDFEAAENYFLKGGNPNVPEAATGETALLIAVKKALPQQFAVKNYPFEKSTFLFLKKLITCGLRTGVTKVSEALLNDPQGDVLQDEILEGNLADNKEEVCNEQGECTVAPEKQETPDTCLSAEEIAQFVAQVKRDGPNSVTAVIDIASAMLDVIFDYAYYEEGALTPEVKMVKLLMANKASLMPEINTMIVQNMNSLYTYNHATLKQSSIRLAADAAIAFLTMISSGIASSYLPHNIAQHRWPFNGAYFLIAVKSIIDLRNAIGVVAHEVVSQSENSDIQKVLKQ